MYYIAYSMIMKPGRITTCSASLSDNIITNLIEREVVGRLLIINIKGHLPVIASLQAMINSRINKYNKENRKTSNILNKT